MFGRTQTRERRDYPCWAIVRPAPDVAGKWVAHCLEFDTLAQADDPETAARLLLESTGDIVLEDLQCGLNPVDRRAPDDDEGWALVADITQMPSSGKSLADVVKEMSSKNPKLTNVLFAFQFMLSFKAVSASPPAPRRASQPIPVDLPAARPFASYARDATFQSAFAP